ncbi:MAG TPA: ribonuclease T2 [Devosia sp.]|nr:ribonuclease T2 [Devosia sp.]
MDRRFSLALIVAFLIGSALMLWLNGPRESAAPATATASPSAAPTAATASDNGTFGLYTLAVSWQPAFCETEPNKPECRSLTGNRYDADHFALHGLWPQDNYCGVSQDQIDADTYDPRSTLSDVDLTDATRTALDRAMPGTQSLLERHEWLMHGTCSGVSAETYYARAIALLDELNASPVRDLFAGSAGQRVSAEEIREAFDMAFGNGAGYRVRIDCADDGPRTIIVELRIRLYGDAMGPMSFRSLINRATAGSGGCAFGEIDRVGAQ